MKKILIIAACLTLIFAATAFADGDKYSGTIIVAGMGGHFSVAKVTVDTSDRTNPIKIKNLDRIVIGNKKTHPVHDPRIDVNDRTKMYWSTYKIDKSAGPRAAHVGLSDLKTGKKLIDKVVQLDDRAKWTGALYCGSGQTKKYFLPVTMTDEAYIDVRNKSDLSLKKRVFLDYKPGETRFYHGTNTPDMSKFVVVINRANNGKPNGNIDVVMLDAKALEKGKAKVLAKNKITGAPGKTLTFRQTFTPDGKYLLQSGADRFFVLDGKTLDLIDEEVLGAKGANHDAVPTPDGKYAILTLRTKVKNPLNPEGKTVTDGTLQLYDMKAKGLVGEPASVCLGCHSKLGLSGSAVLCGADVNWD